MMGFALIVSSIAVMGFAAVGYMDLINNGYPTTVAILIPVCAAAGGLLFITIGIFEILGNGATVETKSSCPYCGNRGSKP
jgi:hypothetical protein